MPRHAVLLSMTTGHVLRASLCSAGPRALLVLRQPVTTERERAVSTRPDLTMLHL